MAGSDMEKEKGEISHIPTVDDHHLDEKTKLSRSLLIASFICYLAAFNYGFSAALIAATLQSPALYAYMPILTTANAPNLIGAVVCMTNAGGAVGVIINTYTGEMFGRKKAFMGTVFLTLLGTALSAGAVNYPMLVIGRAIQLMGGWGGVATAIGYVQEIAPTFARGHFGGGIGPAINSGYCAAAWVQVGFYYWNDALNWRIPQVFAALPPLGIAAMLFVVPESPRWLVAKGQDAKALEVFKKLHRDDKKDPHFVVAREEHFQVVKQIALDKTLPASWIDMFSKKYRKRTLGAMLITFVNQMTGPQVITNYGPGLYASAGLTGGSPLLVAAGWYICCVLFAAFWTSRMETIGRKRLLCYGVLMTLLSFSIITALYAVTVDQTVALANPKPAQNAFIFMFFFYVFWYQMSEPAMFTYIGEIFGSHVRNKGICLGLLGITITSSWLTMAFPVGIANIKWKFLLVLIACMAIGVVLQFVLLRETKGIPLEEMPALFGDTEDVALTAREINLAVVEAEERRRKAEMGV